MMGLSQWLQVSRDVCTVCTVQFVCLDCVVGNSPLWCGSGWRWWGKTQHFMGEGERGGPSGSLLLHREVRGGRLWGLGERERVEECEGERGFLASHGMDQTTAGWFHSSLASHSSHQPLHPLKPSPSSSPSICEATVGRRIFVMCCSSTETFVNLI